MAYIIGEPIITYCGKVNNTHDIEVKFPVLDTLVNVTHYRGIRIALDPQKLWMLSRDGEAPRWVPRLLPDSVFDQDFSYAENLLRQEELQEEYRKKFIAAGFDPDDEAKYRQWLRDLIPF